MNNAPDRAEPDRVARTVARLHRHEVREFLRAVALFERVGILTPTTADAWREAVRARAAELSECVEEA